MPKHIHARILFVRIGTMSGLDWWHSTFSAATLLHWPRRSRFPTEPSALFLRSCGRGLCASPLQPSLWVDFARSKQGADLFRALLMYSLTAPPPCRIIIIAGFSPLLLLPSLTRLAAPDSWEARSSLSRFLPLYTLEAGTAVILGTLLFAWSFRFKVGVASARAAHDALIARVAMSQSLLETAMPRPVARALLAGTPAYELTTDFDPAIVCFISLVDFERTAADLGPEALLTWLNRIYGAFDALVDLYPANVSKIECVSDVYLVCAWQQPQQSRLPCPSSQDIAVLIGHFCADLLEMCESIEGLNGPVRVQVGLHSGQVTAGVVGRTRRFYRIFGDTVNVASRMMASGMPGRIHCSDAFSCALHATDDDGRRVHGLDTECRGSIPVKGKGLMTTHWLSRSVPAELVESLVSFYSSGRESTCPTVPCDVRRGQRGAFVTSAPEKLTTPRATAPVNTASPASIECTVVHEIAQPSPCPSSPAAGSDPGTDDWGARRCFLQRVPDQRTAVASRKVTDADDEMVWQEGTPVHLPGAVRLTVSCTSAPAFEDMQLNADSVAEDRGQRPTAPHLHAMPLPHPLSAVQPHSPTLRRALASAPAAIVRAQSANPRLVEIRTRLGVHPPRPSRAGSLLLPPPPSLAYALPARRSSGGGVSGTVWGGLWDALGQRTGAAVEVKRDAAANVLATVSAILSPPLDPASFAEAVTAQSGAALVSEGAFTSNSGLTRMQVASRLETAHLEGIIVRQAEVASRRSLAVVAAEPRRLEPASAVAATFGPPPHAVLSKIDEASFSGVSADGASFSGKEKQFGVGSSSSSSSNASLCLARAPPDIPLFDAPLTLTSSAFALAPCKAGLQGAFSTSDSLQSSARGPAGAASAAPDFGGRIAPIVPLTVTARIAHPVRVMIDLKRRSAASDTRLRRGDTATSNVGVDDADALELSGSTDAPLGSSLTRLVERGRALMESSFSRVSPVRNVSPAATHAPHASAELSSISSPGRLAALGSSEVSIESYASHPLAPPLDLPLPRPSEPDHELSAQELPVPPTAPLHVEGSNVRIQDSSALTAADSSRRGAPCVPRIAQMSCLVDHCRSRACPPCAKRRARGSRDSITCVPESVEAAIRLSLFYRQVCLSQVHVRAQAPSRAAVTVGARASLCRCTRLQHGLPPAALFVLLLRLPLAPRLTR